MSLHLPCFPAPQAPPAHPLLQSHIRIQSSEELTEILHMTRRVGSQLVSCGWWPNLHSVITLVCDIPVGPAFSS